MEDIKIALQAVRLFFPNANTIRILVETDPEEHKKFSEAVMEQAGSGLQESNPDLYNAILDGTHRFSDVTFGAGTAIHVRSNQQS
jgi:hypothetical protein